MKDEDDYQNVVVLPKLPTLDLFQPVRACFVASPLLNWEYRVTPPPIPQYQDSPELRLFTETAQN